MCWDMIGLVSSLDILLAFAPDICDADMCPICSQLIKGPGASFCYLDLSMAPVDPWVSATSSVYSWLGWSMHAFTGPCLHLESIAPRGCLLCSAVSLPYQSCPMSWSCTVVSAPSAKRRLEWGPICPQSLELTGHSFFLSDHLPDSVSISLPSSLLCKATDMLNGPLLPVPSFPAHLRCKILFKS